jgi:hypothetical protein
MSLGMNTYDPGQVTLVLGAPPSPISGFMPDTFIEAARDIAAFTKHVGADGEVTRVRSRNKAGSITVTLQQGSASNDYFTALALLDETPAGVPLNCTLTDKSGRTLITSPFGWVEKIADVSLHGTAEQGRKWKIDLGPTAIFVGGN